MSRLRLRDEDGFSLIELLVASSLMLVILSATLAAFTGAEAQNVEANARAEVQDVVRRETDGLARELRNLAAPVHDDTAGSTLAALGIDRASPFDLVFRTVDAVGPNTGDNAYNVRRVRWCLSTGVAAMLFEQVQTWTTANPPAAPADPACPGDGWPGQPRRIVDDVTNRATSPARPLFLFDVAAAAADGTLTAEEAARVTHIRTDLAVDLNGHARPGDTRLRSGVFLRNHNRPPTVADFTTQTSSGRLLLNGSLATDPEGEPLAAYVWKDGGVTMACDPQGMVALCTPEGTGSRQITLVVRDRAGLEASLTKAVTP
jgi:prepilin-type N-terminal cleavage/methylation domain-containing protein